MEDVRVAGRSIRYLSLMAREYPTIQAVSSEIINLQAICNLPKATEHFMSDIHGEHEAFLHITNNASGAIRDRIEWYLETRWGKERGGTSRRLYITPSKRWSRRGRLVRT